MKGALDEHEDCHNYVRVLVRQPSGLVLICATHSFNPMCRQYRLDERGDYQIVREFSGSAISPRDPQHNSTAIYVSETDELYAGTVVDFAGLDPLIYRKSLSGNTAELSTPRNDLAVLNDPNFVASSEDNDHVYFWFREVAAETEHMGKTVYPRVGRVCKRDQGGPRRYEDTWTTFVKARLNCSLSGDYRYG